jgi:hypothetical protein
MVQSTALTHASPSESIRRFIITMWAEPDQKAYVRSCEIYGSNFRNRTSFNKDTVLEHVFCLRFAAALKECLDQLSLDTQVLSLPSFLVELPGLTVRGAHVIATKVKDGPLNIIIRFGSFIGGINYAFRNSLGFDNALANEREALGTHILEDIASPLLDICNAAETGLSDAVDKLGAFGRHVCARSHEIRFRVELLKRFVSGQQVEEPAFQPVKEIDNRDPFR